MNLLIISHAGVLATNRALFSTLATQSGWKVKMIVPTEWKGDLIRELKFEPNRSDGVLEVIPVPVRLSGSGSFFSFRGSLKKILASWQPDLVFVDEEPWSLAAFQIYFSFRDCKKVFYTKQNLFKLLPPPFLWIQNWVFRNSVAAISVADLVTEVLRKKKFLGPIIDLPHSFDPALFRQAPDRDSLRRHFELPAGIPVVAYVGRLSQEKGIHEWSQVIQNWNQSALPCFFWTVGNGNLAGKMPLGKWIPALPHDEVCKALQCIDLLVLPSRTEKNWKEQFGRILIEAAGSGSALLGSNSGEIPFLIAKLQGGLIFRERDAKDFSQVMGQALGQPGVLEKFKKSAFINAHSRYSHSAVASQLEKALRTIALN